MNRYRLIRQKPFESLTHFETRLNEECLRDWRIANLTGTSHGLTALLERENRH